MKAIQSSKASLIGFSLFLTTLFLVVVLYSSSSCQPQAKMPEVSDINMIHLI
ncbi:MAG: hypothetical protein GXC72_08360 [Chitinophagaceae bacterium]|jgi:hypothetical protein|nr:hypothetical protein [Chitinophagaceae bacterium]